MSGVCFLRKLDLIGYICLKYCGVYATNKTGYRSDDWIY
jgi:uncharacterized protein YuzB (UPF0349 family)